MNEECCYTCLNWDAALCMIREDYDDVDPNTFKCEEYEKDDEE